MGLKIFMYTMFALAAFALILATRVKDAPRKPVKAPEPPDAELHLDDDMIWRPNR